jgi:hypothetical protein
MVRENLIMSRIRVLIEWIFGKITTIFAFLDYPKKLQMQKFPIGKHFVVGALLLNFHTCFYAGLTASQMGVMPPHPADYANQ